MIRVTRYSNFIEEIEGDMPIKKVKGGYRWGSRGKVYKRRKDAVAQAQAAHASGYVEPKPEPKR